MPIDERKRHGLYERLDEVLDDEHADTLMEPLPPVGWADVVTKRDLDLKIDALESRIRADLHSALRQQLWAILGVLVMAVVLIELAARLS